jgi:D-alanyl-D-alanine carboxypeptidase (penicillin-binding protein 5/6)
VSRRAVRRSLAAVLAAAALPSSAAAAPPPVSARAAIVVEAAGGDVLYARNPDVERQIASTTKLMTALVTLEQVDLADVLTAAPYRAAPAESVVGLRAGERLSVADLLRALLLPSANDAAATLATSIAGSRARFVAMMNARARELKLTHTSYANPIGLDAPGNHSTARDLVTLARVLRRNRFFVDTTDRARLTLHTGARRRTIVNRNLLVARYEYVNGVKTGHTSGAGYVLVGSATRNGVTVLSAVLGEPTEAARDADSLALLNYGLDQYRRVTPVRARQRLAVAGVKDQGDERAVLVAAKGVGLVTRRGERLAVRVVGVPKQVEGPLPAGSRVGTVEVRRGGQVVTRVALVTAAAVPEPSATERMRAWLGRPLTMLLLAALVLCSLLLVLLRLRAVRARSTERPDRLHQ